MGTRPANVGSNLMNLEVMGEEAEEGEEEAQGNDAEDYVDIPEPTRSVRGQVCWEDKLTSRPASLASPLSMANSRTTNGRS
jgi:hypothetical protein